MKNFIEKSKFPLLLAFTNLVLFLIVIFYINTRSGGDDALLFVDSKCIFCEETIDEINFRRYKDHIRISVKSLEGNSLNKNLFDRKVQECNLGDKQKGVPMLYTGGKCFKGKLEILQELERLSIQN